MNQLDEAEDCLNVAYELRKKIEHHLLLPVYIKLGELYIEKGNFELAEKTLKNALTKINVEKANMTRYVQALVTLGDCSLERELYENAMKPYQQALKLAQKHNLEYQEHEIQKKLCICCDKVGDKDQFISSVVEFFRLNVKLSSKGGGLIDDQVRR